MTSILSPRMALFDVVKAALLAVNGEGDYFHRIPKVVDIKVAVSDVQLDALPWVPLMIGDDHYSDKSTSQRMIDSTDVAIDFLIKPDPNRQDGMSVYELLERGIWDVRRTMERNAGAAQYGMYTARSLHITRGPRDEFALATFVYTYDLRGSWGQ